jgi:hypothetical protein
MPHARYTLKRFGQYSVRLAELLKEGTRLSADEQMFLENHLLIVQLALAMSKYHPTNKSRAVHGD